MAQKALPEEELDMLLRRVGQAGPVDSALLEGGRVDAALDDVWRNAQFHGDQRAPVPTASSFARRRRWATAAIAVVVVGVASLVGVESLTGGSGDSGLPLAVSPAAAAQLNKVARAASAQAALTAGQWEYVDTKTVQLGSIRAGRAAINFRISFATQSWYGADGYVRLRSVYQGGSYLTPQDQANFEANRAAVLKRYGGQDPTTRRAGAADIVDPPEGRPQSPSPTSNPQTLISEISTSEQMPAHGDSEALWGALTHLLLTSTSPQLRSTAFRALSYVHGAKVLGKQTDQLGRSGVAISFTDGTATEPGDSIPTIIVSPSTGEILEDDETLAVAHNALPAGTVLFHEIFVQQRVVDSDTALPGGGSQPLPAGLNQISSASPPAAASTTPTSPVTPTTPPTPTGAQTSATPKTSAATR